MTQLPITSLTTALLGVLFLLLSVRVVQQRVTNKAGLGDGNPGLVPVGTEGQANKLFVAARCHANFAEYVPLSLILIGLLELAGATRWLLLGLAIALVLARILHPIGMNKGSPNPFRVGGTMLQFSVLIIGSIALLIAQS